VVKGRLRGWRIVLMMGIVVAVVVALASVAPQRRPVPPASKVTAIIKVGNSPGVVAAAPGAVWVTNQRGESVSRIE
jgi:hypothetical protein